MTPTRAVRMTSNRQLAYLDAMDIGVWFLSETCSSATPDTDNAPELKLGPGGGGILLICAADTDSASRLANDISRVLGSIPVWGWPHAGVSAVNLTAAVEDNLFTTVAIFGDELALQFFDGALPASLNSAKLVLLPAMQDIQGRAETRQALWATLCRSGMVNSPLDLT